MYQQIKDPWEGCDQFLTLQHTPTYRWNVFGTSLMQYTKQSFVFVFSYECHCTWNTYSHRVSASLSLWLTFAPPPKLQFRFCRSLAHTKPLLCCATHVPTYNLTAAGWSLRTMAPVFLVMSVAPLTLLLFNFSAFASMSVAVLSTENCINSSSQQTENAHCVVYLWHIQFHFGFVHFKCYILQL